MLVLLTLHQNISPQWLLTFEGASVFAGAAAEELVFRLLLPYTLFALWVRTRSGSWWRWAVCIFVSQVAFAAAHFGGFPPSLVSTVRPALELLVSGLCYSALANSTGLFSAIAAHGFVNARHIAIDSFRLSTGSTVELVVLALLSTGLAAIWPPRSQVLVRPSRPSGQ